MAIRAAELEHVGDALARPTGDGIDDCNTRLHLPDALGERRGVEFAGDDRIVVHREAIDAG